MSNINLDVNIQFVVVLLLIELELQLIVLRFEPMKFVLPIFGKLVCEPSFGSLRNRHLLLFQLSTNTGERESMLSKMFDGLNCILKLK